VSEPSPDAPEVSVEATGETVGEAKWKALRELERLAPGLDETTVRFQVVSEGERGLLGVGYAPARVVATGRGGETAPAEPRADETPLEHRVRLLVERIVGALGVAASVDVVEGPDQVTATATGDDLGLLIGKHGSTIDALQYLLNAILFRSGEGKPVTVDAAGYRARRRATLDAIALRAAEQARLGDRVVLDPMTAVERKVVHERLKDVAGIETRSEGTEPNRCVVVLPRDDSAA
jgi:spoIIIJ-associated protein